MVRVEPSLEEAHTLTTEGPLAAASGGARVAVLGAFDDALSTSLRAHGLVPVVLAEPSELDEVGHDAIYAPGASVDLLSELRARSVPLVTDSAPSDMGRIATLLGVGVDEAVPRPVRPHELVKRICRALLRAGRRGR
jgi:DNA-binding response OmpR family regulator